jgi:hypothetical protein
MENIHNYIEEKPGEGGKLEFGECRRLGKPMNSV